MSMLAEKRRRLTRETIMEVALDLFSRNGYQNTHVMEIITTVGISAATFYKHFRDKADLFDQITRYGIADLRAQVRSAREPVDIWSRADRRAKLERMYAALFEYVDANSLQLLMIMRGSVAVADEHDGSVWSYFSKFSDDLCEEVSVWKQAGALHTVNPRVFAHCCIGMALNMIHAYLTDDSLTRQECTSTLIVFNLALFDSYCNESAR